MAQTTKTPLVLVVDDYQDAREMYCEYLELAGFRVAAASTGLEALEKASLLHPSVVLMDLSLPVLDGWEATRRLKADPSTQAIPVVALTGHGFAGNAEKARRAGCDAFLSKPCLPQDVLTQVRAVLRSASAAPSPIGARRRPP